MDKKIEYIAPMEIEKRSFELITQELKGKKLKKEEEPIIKRVIHTTADFDYAETLYFHKDAIKQGLEAIKNGAHLVTDTTMALSGINKRVLAGFGGDVHCYIAEKEIAEEAKKRGVTRSQIAIDTAVKEKKIEIYVIGNAPTALIRTYELIQNGAITPALVIGVPVGFVNVVEAKDLFFHSEIPCIIARGRKGGSNVAAAIVNALLYLASEGRRE